MKELKNIEREAPILFGLDKKNQLDVPKGYFESIEPKLIQISDEKPVITINYRKILITISSIAALFIIVFSLYHNNNTKQDSNTFNQLTIASFEEEMIETNETYILIDFEDIKKIDLDIYSLDEL